MALSPMEEADSEALSSVLFWESGVIFSETWSVTPLRLRRKGQPKRDRNASGVVVDLPFVRHIRLCSFESVK